MQIESVNTDVKYDAGSVIERPAGLPGYLLLHHITAGQLLARNGLCEERPGVCVIYPPGVAQKSVASHGELRADGIYFTGPQAGPLVASLQLPLNAPFYPREDGFIRPLLSDIQTEMTRREKHWERLVVLGLTQLLVRMAQNLDHPRQGPALTPQRAAQRDLLQGIRLQAHGELDQCWTVAKLARCANMSPPRFFTLYKEFFGISPIEDLIRARIDSACWLLTNTKVTMEDVARRTGFASASYFCQVFKKRIGCPPSQYYRTHVAS